MANERRLRPNYVAGTIDTALDTVGVTISGQALSRLPVIDASNYAVLTLVDPVAGAYEIVYVLAHASGAATATMLRACEGSTARAWPANTTFVAAPSSADFRPSLDDLWAGNLGYDDDFDRSGVSTLPTGWTWISQNGASYYEDRGWGHLITPGYASASGFFAWQLWRLLPSQATWTATVKVSQNFPKSAQAGAPGGNIAFGIRGAGPFVQIEPRWHMNTLMVNSYTNPTTYLSSPLNASWQPTGVPVYLQISKTGTNTYTFALSTDGGYFLPVLTNYTPPFTADTLVLSAMQEAGPVGPGVASFDWFRVR